jgi:hypothetical protein
VGKTLYYTAASLDGYIADEHHSRDWLFQFGDGGEGGFETFIRGRQLSERVVILFAAALRGEGGRTSESQERHARSRR